MDSYKRFLLNRISEFKYCLCFQYVAISMMQEVKDIRYDDVFTFQFVTILIIEQIRAKTKIMSFTFQYVAILIVETLFNNSSCFYLHSNMSLF